jgi:hypothetical protein
MSKKAILLTVLGFFGFIFIGFLVFMIALIVIFSQSNKDVRDENPEIMTQIQEDYSNINTIKSNIPRVEELQENQCPEAEIKKNITDEGLVRPNISILDMEYLDYYSPNKGSVVEHDEDWMFLNTGELVELQRYEEITAKWEIENTQRTLDTQSRYVAVLVTETKSLPVDFSEDDEDGLSFLMGRFEGWMVIYDLQEAKPICQTPFEFSSSEEVYYIDDNGSQAKKGLLSDFEENYHEEAENTLGLLIEEFEYPSK